MGELIYLDHAATSWPKPPEVAAAMLDALQHSGANAYRGNHSLAIGTGRVLVRARSMLAELFLSPTLRILPLPTIQQWG